MTYQVVYRNAVRTNDAAMSPQTSGVVGLLHLPNVLAFLGHRVSKLRLSSTKPRHSITTTDGGSNVLLHTNTLHHLNSSNAHKPRFPIPAPLLLSTFLHTPARHQHTKFTTRILVVPDPIVLPALPHIHPLPHRRAKHTSVQ